MKLKELHEKLKYAKTVSAVNAILKSFLSSYGIDTFALTCYYKKGKRQNTVVEYSYISPSFQTWHDHYHSENYDEIDTTSQQAKLSNLPVFWEIHQQIAESKTQRERKMRLDSLWFGADRGLTIPVHRDGGEKAILMVEQLQGEHCLDDWATLQYELLAGAHYYYHYLRARLLKERPRASNQYQLNDRQMQCLKLVAEGYSMDEIAKKLKITERTVNYHIQKMNKNLGTKNKYLSVAKARRDGLIE